MERNKALPLVDSPLELMEEEDLENLFGQYRQNFDRIVELGLAQAKGEYVLLRGITFDKVQGGGGGQIYTGHAQSATDIRQAPVFEIVACGPLVPDVFRRGLHCIPISAGIDPIRSDVVTSYANVNHEDIVIAWDPDEVAAELRDDPNSAVNARKRANGLD